MNRILILILVSAGLIILLLPAHFVSSEDAAPETQKSTQSPKPVSASDAASLVQKNKNNPDFIILDVRTEEEYSGGHIENAINVDVTSESFTKEVLKLDKENTYVIHCRSGKRSAKAGAILQELGFRDVYDIQGGISAWKEEGLPVTK